MYIIKDILNEYGDKGLYVDVYFSRSRDRRLCDNILVSSDNELAFTPVNNVDIDELFAESYDIYEDESSYTNEVADPGGMFWNDYAGEDGKILLIWLSSLSYRMLTDSKDDYFSDSTSTGLSSFTFLVKILLTNSPTMSISIGFSRNPSTSITETQTLRFSSLFSRNMDTIPIFPRGLRDLTNPGRGDPDRDLSITGLLGLSEKFSKSSNIGNIRVWEAQ